jgi:hypothetical protein
MTEVRNVLKTSQEKFKKERETIDKIGVRIADLVKARQAAFVKAKTDFNASAELARSHFKAVLGQTMSATGTDQTGDYKALDNSATNVKQ